MQPAPDVFRKVAAMGRCSAGLAMLLLLQAVQ